MKKEFLWSLVAMAMTSTMSFLPYLGLMGIGPDKLPSSVTFTYKDKLGTIGNDGTETYPCSYEFNADGSVAKANGWEYTYEYATGSK